MYNPEVHIQEPASSWIPDPERTRSVLRSSGIGVWELNLCRLDSAWTPETFELFGMEPADRLVALPEILARIHPADVTRVQAAVDVARVVPIDLEYRILLDCGATRHVRSRMVSDGRHRPGTVTGIIEDITERRTLERQLREGQERYESLKKYNPNGICSLDLHGQITDANQAFERMTGYTLDEWRCLPLFNTLFLPQDAEWAEAAFFNRLVENVETRVRHRDGHTTDVAVTSVPMVVDGRRIGFYIMLQDISQRKRVECELRTTQRLYQMISMNALDVIARSDASGRVIYISPSVTPVLGYRPEELVGQEFSHLFHPEDWPTVAALGERLVAGEDVERFTARVVTKDGGLRWCETTLRVARDLSGRLLEVVGVSRDVSETIQLRESFEHAAEIARLGHWTWDAETHSLSLSRQMCVNLGLPAETGTLTAKRLRPIVHPEDLPGVVSDFREVIRAGDTFHRVLRVLLPDGAVRYLECQGEVMRGGEGEVVRVMGTTQDVTDRKQAEETIMKAEKLSAVGQLAAGIAHEIRNPLTALKGFTQLLAKRADTDSQRYFRIMQDELSRIERIVNEMLLLAKPQATAYRVLHLQPLVAEVVALLEPEALMNGVHVHIADAPALPPVEGDPGQLKQVWINIVKNAIEAMPGGGHVDVRCGTDPTVREAWVEVADDGPGIAADRLSQLGTPFFSTKEKGTGLGMMVSRRIVEQHAGRLEVQSAVGVGTTVRVTLPAYRGTGA